MPTYEYECLECKKRFDVFQKMTDGLIQNCQSCNGKVKRLIGSGAGIIFKGSGFYVNDYKSSSAAASSGKSSEKPAGCEAAKGNSCNGCAQKAV